MDLKGLSYKEVEKKQKVFGFNSLKSTSRESLWKKFFRQFKDLMVVLLLVSSGVAIGIGYLENSTSSVIDGFVILTIVVLNAGIGFFQEYRTEKAIDALKKFVSPSALVIRDGKKQKVDAKLIVPGDIIILSAGDKVPADGEILWSSGLKIEESALTGESVPLNKRVEDTVYLGTTCVAGTAYFKASHTGMNTRFGNITHLTTSTEKDLSPLQKELLNIGIFVGKITLIISVILIFSGILFQGKSFVDALLFAVSVAVAAVPEGLPATITVALALGVQKMVKKNAVVKQLSSIETLGSTSTICSDKTGTLTQNKMVVKKLFLSHNEVCSVDGTGYNPRKGFIYSETFKTIKNTKNLYFLREISQQCSEAELIYEKKKWNIIGDPTEAALLCMAAKKEKGINNRKNLEKYSRNILFEIPFDSSRKRMSILTESNKKHLVLVKGSPESILEKCNYILKNEKKESLDALEKNKIKDQSDKMANEALRVLAFAYKTTTKNTLNRLKENKDENISTLESELIFVGLAGMIDPARKEVKPAVKQCHQAGIRTLIITGDYGKTAFSIAKSVGIADENCPVITGKMLDQKSDKELDKILKKQTHVDIKKQSIIFSRVSPEHKKRIVDRLKHLKEIVAVTGDGVNDAPALKRADLGIAMGITGTEVSKETANMVLLDDSFASIVSAIKEGRKIYKNLIKFSWFVFSCNIGELFTVFTAILLGIPTPLTASLILAIDLGTDILPAIALGLDHAEPGIMKEKPRKQNKRIMTRGFITHFSAIGFYIGVIVIALYLWKLSSLGWSWGENIDASTQSSASTLAFASLVVIQLFNVFNARSFKLSSLRLKTLWPLWGSIVVSTLLLLAIVHLEFFQFIFKTSSLNFSDWLLVIGAGGIVLLTEETRKFLFSKKEAHSF